MTDSVVRQYVYKVTDVVRVIDGDTFWVRLDVGFRQTILAEIRLWGYDTPELHGSPSLERAAALEAKELTAAWLTKHKDDLWVRTEPDTDNFGRWLGEVFSTDAAHLGDALREKSLASVWPTRWREEFGEQV